MLRKAMLSGCVALCVIVLCACGNGTTPIGDAPHFSGLPSIAELEALNSPREASWVYYENRLGADYFAANAESMGAGQTLELQPGADGLAWAIYPFVMGGPTSLAATLRVTSTISNPPAGIFAGVADFRDQTWQFVPLTFDGDDAQVAIDPALELTGDSGFAYIALVSYDPASWGIYELRFGSESIVATPEGGEASTERHDGIMLGWDDPAMTSDPDGIGPEVYEYDAIQIYRSELPDSNSPELIGTVLKEPGIPAETTYFDDDPGLLPLTLYYYRLRTVKYGVASPPSGDFSGYIGVPPVAEIQVTHNGQPGSQEVTLEAIASDPDGGKIVKYEWDLNEDGVYEYLLGVNKPQLVVELDMSQEQTVHLRVTDNEGYTATAVKTFGPN